MNHSPKKLNELSLVSYIFANSSPTRLISDVVLERDMLTIQDLTPYIFEINKRFDKIAIKNSVIEDITQGNTIMLGNRETVKFPTAVNNWRMMTSSKPISVVNLVPVLTSNGLKNLDIRRLFGFMTLGTLSIRCYKNWNNIISNRDILENCTIMYSRMMFKVCDRLVAISQDTMKSDYIKYIFAKYFIINLMQKVPSEGIDIFAAEIATRGGKNNLNLYRNFEANLAMQLKDIQTQSALYNLSFIDFISTFKDAAPWLSRFSIRQFVSSVVLIYGHAGLLMCEDLIYFLQGVITNALGTEIISSFSFEAVAGNMGIDVMAKLIPIIS